MKILALSDFHSQEKILPWLNFLISRQKYDLALIAGDLTVRNALGLDYVMALAEIFQQANLPWYAVHGNNDSPDVANYLALIHRNLHFESANFSGYRLVGLGGFGDELPPYELKLQGAIFVSHYPPNLHRSLKINLTDSPLLHLAGHMHHWAKASRIHETLVVNIPAALYGRAAEITLPEKKVKFIELPKA